MTRKFKILVVFLSLLIYDSALSCGPHEHSENDVKEETRSSCDTDYKKLSDLCGASSYCDINCKDIYNSDHKHECCSDNTKHERNGNNFINIVKSPDQYHTVKSGIQYSQDFDQQKNAFLKNAIEIRSNSLPIYLISGSFLI